LTFVILLEGGVAVLTLLLRLLLLSLELLLLQLLLSLLLLERLLVSDLERRDADLDLDRRYPVDE
jgi:hypothetical protein